MTIKKGDQIQVIAGRDKGKRGVVEKVIAETSRVVVGGVNIRKHHLKRSSSRPQGGIIEMPGAFSRANVMVVCPHCSKLTRIAHTISEQSKFRSCIHCKGSLDNAK
ncbi:MAG: 50S ribosomal protein L24 [bacterium]